MTGTIARVGDPHAATMPERPADDLRTWLKNSSASDHARLDDLMGTFDLHDPDQYGRFLTAHAIGVGAVQPAAAVFVRNTLARDLPDAAAMLAADMNDIGLPPPPPAPPPMADQGAGAAYVLLGSRLGLAVIGHGVALPAGVAGRYLFDRSLGALWRPMRDWLQAQPAHGAQADAALAGTRAAFAAFTAGALAARRGLPA